MRELDFLPAWYVQLNRERLLLRRTILSGTMAVVLAVALQGVASWRLTRGRAALVRLQQQSTLLAAANQRQLALLRQRDRLAAEYLTWSRAAAPVSAVALSQRLGHLLPSKVTLTHLKVDAGGTEHAGMVSLSGVASSEVDVAALLLSLNGDRKFDQVQLSSVRDQRLQGESMKRFELSFVASADANQELP